MTSNPTIDASPAADIDQRPSGHFTDLGLDAGLLKGLHDMGYIGPTPVQRETLTPALDGQDLIVQAKTGSGKTSAFGVAIMQALASDSDESSDQRHPRALALCPTRELARQVASELSDLAQHMPLRVACIYGGAAFGPQLDLLERGVDVVVGTPGRVIDHIRRGTLKLQHVRFMVLDEADEMLSMGFWDEVTSVLDRLRHQHQTLLFSATLPHAIQRAAARYLSDPTRLELSGDDLTVSGIDNVVYLADDKLPKPRNLLYILEAEKPDSAIIFCNRRGETELICNVLKRFGYTVGMLNSDLSQRAREKVLDRVKARLLPILVATDVAARGIDIDDLSHIFNYDLPEHSEVYLHRAGRTGRIGKRGTAVSLVRGMSTTRRKEIARLYGVDFIERQLPSQEAILTAQTDRILKKIFIDAEHVELSQYQAVAETLLARDQAPEAVAFLLRNYFASDRSQGARGRNEKSFAPVALRVDAGTARGLDEGKLKTLLAEAGGRPVEDVISVELREDEAKAEVDQDLADALLRLPTPIQLGDGHELSLHELDPRPSQARGGGGRGRGGPRGSARGRSGKPRGRR